MHKGKYLKYLIEQQKISQVFIASSLNYSTAKVSRIMKDVNPDDKIISDILELLNTTQEDFKAGLKLFNPGGVNQSGYNELMEFKIRYITEKDQWLNEKAELLAKQEELQEKIERLNDK